MVPIQVGLAAMLTSMAHVTPNESKSSAAAAIMGVIVGGVTLTGSIVAFLKLHGVVRSSRSREIFVLGV